ncbi:MAG: aminofutalosine synthase MqnE [Pyrinomonadaceae bacterium]
MQLSFDKNLNEISEKLAVEERLTFDEGIKLFTTDDLNALGKLADWVRRKKHGKTTYYNVNRHFNHTNICVADCKFCGFYRRARQEDSYTYTVAEGIDIARNAVNDGATELHIVGGLNSKLPFEYYTELFSSLKREFPKLHIKALTMVELDFFARFYKMSDEEVIGQLIEAGMDSCPGGGAEILAEPTRSRICDHKCDGERWLELSGKVHKAGLKTNATMLYGHIESFEDRVDHLKRLREQQDKTGGFQCFIPLAFYPPGSALSNLPGPDAVDNLKTIAVSRLMLDNFEHIKAYWVMLGIPTTQMALNFGANDVDGTITDGSELTHAYSVEEGGESRMTKDELVRLIENAGYEAVERDTVYNRVERATV